MQESRTGRRIRLGKPLSGLLVAFGMLVLPAAAEAQGTYSCRASALKAPIIGEPWVANPQYTPCTTDQASAPDGGVVVPGLAKVYVFDARTGSGTNPLTENPQPGHSWAWASVAYAHVTLPGYNIKVWGLSSTAGSKCLGPRNPDIGGSSTIVTLMVNNTYIPVHSPNQRIPLLGLGTLYINYGQKTQNEALTRAVWLDLAGDSNDIIISEARAARTQDVCDQY